MREPVTREQREKVASIVNRLPEMTKSDVLLLRYEAALRVAEDERDRAVLAMKDALAADGKRREFILRHAVAELPA